MSLEPDDQTEPAAEQTGPVAPIAYAHDTAGGGITRSDVATLVVRIIGIYTMLQGVPALVMIFEFGSSRPTNLFLVGGSIFVIIEGIGVALLFSGPWVGRRLLPRTPVVLDRHATPGSPVELQAAAFAFLGVFLATSTVPRLAAEVTNSLLARQSVPQDLQTLFVRLLQPLIELALGIWLFFGSKQLSLYWSRLRRNEPRPRDESGPL